MKVKKAIALVQIVCLVFFNLWNLRFVGADDSDIFTLNVQPNVLLAITSATSMSDTIFSIPYSASTTYTTPQTYTTTTVYKYVNSTPSCRPQPKPCYLVYATSIAAVTDADARTALSTVGYWTGNIGGSSVSLYYGNYLNYTLCTTCSASVTKLSVMQTVLTNLINNSKGLRFGASKYGAGGGLLMDPIQDMTTTNRTQLLNDINTMTLNSSGHPLGEQLKHGGDYYEGHLSGTVSPIQYSCQPNFVILLTDGIATGTDPAGEATDLYTLDQSDSFPGMQNVIVDVVAFALPQADKDAGGIQALRNVATAGGGNFYQAENAAQLEKALQAAINQILAATFSFATPVVPTTGTSSTSRAYLASFQSNPSRPFWRGYLKAYNRDANGLIPVDANNVPLSSAMAWDAGQQLSTKAASSRTIYTVISGNRQDFTTANATITSTVLNASSSSERDNIINFTRGIDAYDENDNGNTTEERQWKLGDIFHSTPVLIQPPFQVSGDSTYTIFKTTEAGRPTVLLAGANDGMLHAFLESDGSEQWSFIPSDLLGDLKDLTATIAPHEFYVDGSPIAADVKIGATPVWKTVVVFGERRGGRSYHALDITDTTNPQYMWSFTDSKIGETWSDPVIGKIRMSDGSSKFIAIVGGGYDSGQNNNSGKAVFVIDVADGTKLWEYYNPGSVTDDRRYMNFSLAAAPTAVDLNNDGFIDRVYVGDVGGQLWKFDFSTPATITGGVISNWDPAQTGKRFFAAAIAQANPPATGEYYPAQAIYVPPALARDQANNLWIFFGTGDRNHPNNTSSNRFYGVKDTTEQSNGTADMTNGSTLTESSLTNLTSGSGTVTQGWYVILNNNEKVLAAADVFSYMVYFTTFTPVATVSCTTGGGDAKMYSVNMTTGDAALNLATGTVLTPGQAALAMANTIGTGIPSRPIVIMTQSGSRATPYVIAGTTNQQLPTIQVPQVTVRRLIGWREVF
ncbi:MAG: pilus assembly protein [Alphaproteobacteria bacterium]